MSGTEMLFGARWGGGTQQRGSTQTAHVTLLLCDVWACDSVCVLCYVFALRCPVLTPASLLRLCFAMSGTDIDYAIRDVRY
eukprot:3177848-Rhodomonas_salina.10